jgi:hypothetical protein
VAAANQGNPALTQILDLKHLPATNPIPIACDSVALISAVPAMPATLQSNAIATGVLDRVLLPATNPAAIANDPVALISAVPPS